MVDNEGKGQHNGEEVVDFIQACEKIKNKRVKNNKSADILLLNRNNN